MLDGTLQSEAGPAYPLLRGIPRLLDDVYLQLVDDLPAEWVQRYRTSVPQASTDFARQQVKTGKSFAEEWQFFSKNLPDYDEIAKAYFDLLAPEHMAGMTLDAGCGMGRWARHVAGQGRALVAVDLSSAVDVAATSLREAPNAHVIQADIHRLPFRSDTFDLIYSLGVLHHVPKPEAGLRALTVHLKPGGRLLAYFYYALDNRPRHFHLLLPLVTACRALISNLHHRLARWVCYVIAVMIYWPLVQIGNLLHAVGLRKIARQIPLYEFYTGKSFGVLFNDSVDRFATSLEFRFSRDEIRSMCARIGLRDIRFSDTTPFWKVAAVKPSSPA